MDFQLFVVYANLAMYAFCFQMQQPVLPATVKALVVGDDSAQEWAQFQSMNGMMWDETSGYSRRSRHNHRRPIRSRPLDIGTPVFGDDCI